jgi:hypothetical protein
MSGKKTFSADYIRQINSSYPWDNSITLVSTNMNKTDNNPITYKLHATGDCTTYNGRQYVALPSNTVITESIKAKYNLMP